MKNLILSTLLIFVKSLFPSILLADWINLSGSENSRNIAEIYVEKDHVKIKLEIFIQDLLTFEQLIPDRLLSAPGAERAGAGKRARQFSEHGLQIITGTGEKLIATLDLAEPRVRVKRPSPFAGMINPYTRQPIPGPPEDKRVLYVELTYPFTGRPESLQFIPPVDEKGFPKASIGFACYHQGVTVVDFRQLPASSTLKLDWEDPWYSTFKRKQYQRKLQSGARTYLYIEPYEVRHEILVRVKDMMGWMDFNLRGNAFIEEDEFDPVRRQVAQFFMEREKVLIDGQQLKPILDRTAYVESSMLRSRFIEIAERIPLNTAMIGIVITYLTDGIPDEVVTHWDLFNERVQKVTGSMIDPAGPYPYDLEPGDNVLKWNNYLKNYTIPTVDKVVVDSAHQGISLPLLSLLCGLLLVPVGFSTYRRRKKSQPVAGQLFLVIVLLTGTVVLFPFYHQTLGSSAKASKISEEEVETITLNLLKNIYRSFDFREEEDIYDKLAISVDGDLLTDIYLQNRKSMIIEQAGGAQARVDEVKVLDGEVRPSQKQQGAIDVRTKWTALGSVGHWGHVHIRQNVYDAILTLAVVDGYWKITKLELLEEKRLDPYGTNNPGSSS